MPKLKTREEKLAFYRGALAAPILAPALGSPDLRLGIPVESPAAAIAHADLLFGKLKDALWGLQRTENGPHKSDLPDDETDEERAGRLAEREVDRLAGRHRAQGAFACLIVLLLEMSESLGLSGANTPDGLEAAVATFRAQVEQDDRDLKEHRKTCGSCSCDDEDGLLELFGKLVAGGKVEVLHTSEGLASAIAKDREPRSN